MNSDRISARVSEALRRRVQAAGDESAAVRALLILGLHAAGYDVRDLAADIMALTFASLDARSGAAIQKTFNTVLHEMSDISSNIPPQIADQTPLPSEDGDPFANIGIAV